MKNETMDEKEVEAVNQSTRAIYHQQHLRMLNDQSTMDRLHAMGKEEFFQRKKDYFRDKKILEVGCGSTARNTVSFYEFGARDLTAFDLGEAWKETAKINLKNYHVEMDCVAFFSGKADDLPFADGCFDFVCFDGGLEHIPTRTQLEKTIEEIARVTKKGGFFYTSYLAQGGSLMDVLDSSVRQYYRENRSFKNFVDHITPELLDQLFVFILEKMQQHNNEDPEIDLNKLKTLFDEDLCISIQNTIQCHTRWNLDKDYAEEVFQKNGFGKPTRLKRYVKRNNIRKFVSPLHYYHDHEFAKILYGDGFIDCIMEKIR